MKQSKELDQIQAQMKPGVITHDGFLGSDTRKLRDIIEHDDETVKRMGLTHSKIASRLNELREAGKKGLGTDVLFENKLEVRVDSARGKLPCPFQHPGLYQKTYTIVRNPETGSETLFTDLSIHLIEEHGFYGGNGSAYRLNPETLVRELQVKI
jgi:hypothetical protein